MQIPDLYLQLPEQTPKPKLLRKTILKKKNTLETVSNFQTFLSQTISDINARLYKTI